MNNMIDNAIASDTMIRFNRIQRRLMVAGIGYLMQVYLNTAMPKPPNHTFELWISMVIHRIQQPIAPTSSMSGWCLNSDEMIREPNITDVMN